MGKGRGGRQKGDDVGEGGQIQCCHCKVGCNSIRLQLVRFVSYKLSRKLLHFNSSAGQSVSGETLENEEV